MVGSFLNNPNEELLFQLSKSSLYTNSYEFFLQSNDCTVLY